MGVTYLTFELNIKAQTLPNVSLLVMTRVRNTKLIFSAYFFFKTCTGVLINITKAFITLAKRLQLCLTVSAELF